MEGNKGRNRGSVTGSDVHGQRDRYKREMDRDKDRNRERVTG